MANEPPDSGAEELRMTQETLEHDGDALERKTWSETRHRFPHYEDFWRTHLVPLRAAGSIQPRRGIDEDFEFLAMLHYSTYVHVCRAKEKSSDAMNISRFPDEIYIHLYGAAELAVKLVERFNKIYTKCTEENSTLTPHRLNDLAGRFSQYRNLVHEQISAVGIDEANRLMIPLPEKIDQYRKWTTVLYDRLDEDFVDANVQINNDFQRLYSALEDAWKKMCKLSGDLVENKTYLQMRCKGDSPQTADVMIRMPLTSISSAQVSSGTAINPVIVSSATDRKFGR